MEKRSKEGERYSTFLSNLNLFLSHEYIAIYKKDNAEKKADELGSTESTKDEDHLGFGEFWSTSEKKFTFFKLIYLNDILIFRETYIDFLRELFQTKKNCVSVEKVVRKYENEMKSIKREKNMDFDFCEEFRFIALAPLERIKTQLKSCGNLKKLTSKQLDALESGLISIYQIFL